MNPSETRLVIEVALVTAAFTVALGVGLWAYVQARRNAPGAVAELSASQDELARQLRNVERDRISDRQTLLQLHTRLEIQAVYSRQQAVYIQQQAAYSAMLADRLRHLGQDVPPAPGAPPSPPPELDAPLVLRPAVNPDRENTLPEALATLFNNEELDDLALRVGARPEDLIGSTVGRRAASLVLWARRRGRFDRLVSEAQKLRPDGEII